MNYADFRTGQSSFQSLVERYGAVTFNLIVSHIFFLGSYAFRCPLGKWLNNVWFSLGIIQDLELCLVVSHSDITGGNIMGPLRNLTMDSKVNGKVPQHTFID